MPEPARALVPVTLEGAHVRLEPLSLGHVPGLCAHGLDPELWRVSLVHVASEADMRAYVDEALDEARRGVSLPFAITLRHGGDVVGSTRFGDIDLVHARAEIDWTWVAAPWQRTAVNTETKLLLLEHAFERLGCARVELKTDALNGRSRAAILRLGATQEGTFRSHMRTASGRRRDTVYFSILAEEWPGVRDRLTARLGVRNSARTTALLAVRPPVAPRSRTTSHPRPGAVMTLSRPLPLLLLAAATACAPALAVHPSVSSAPATSSAEILWDRYGVPHIHAADTVALFRAFGWAQARAHGDLVLGMYGASRGRAAEYWGAERLEDDRWIHTMRLPEQTRDAWAALSARDRRLFDAFAEGINAHAERHPERIGDRVRAVLPVRGEDVLAQSIGIGLLFSGARGGATQWERAPGSNAWAIAPARSASGNALLLANPHLPWEGGYTWFEARWSAPGLDAYGAALVGTPVLAIAFNQELGWTHTVNTQDLEDSYELRLADGGYRWDGAIRAFRTDTAWIRVRGATGIDSVAHLRRVSVHGPVIAERGERALALRSVRGGWDRVLERTLGMLGARTLEEFETAMRGSLIAGFNTVYADRAGNILYHYGGVSPRRPVDDRAFWQGTVRGDSSALLWTEFHGYDEMPRVLNPPSGWLQNANDPPWFATLPRALDPAAFPRTFGPVSLAARPRQSIRLLRDAPPLTLDGMIALASSTEVELAGRLVPGVVAAARASGSADAVAAAEVLEQWDRTVDAESRGGVLFEAWFGEYTRRAGTNAFAIPWSTADPLETPAGLGDPAAAVAALEAVVPVLRARAGALDVPWGVVHRLRRDGVDLPASGGPGGLGIFRVLNFRADPDGRRTPVQGDGYIAAIEFGTPVRARALTVYGNWSQPGSPHRTDQLELHARRELRPVWLTRAEVEANLAEREVF